MKGIHGRDTEKSNGRHTITQVATLTLIVVPQEKKMKW